MQKIQQAKLDPLAPQLSNQKVSLQQVNQMYNNFFVGSHKGHYYPYNHLTKDEGWGCAWRAIQALISTQGIQLTFEDLYNNFSRKDKLVPILQSNKRYNSEVIKQLWETAWAPAQIALHWAQPFTASIICQYYSIPHHFLLLNGVSFSYAPHSIFQQAEVVTFSKFLEYLKQSIKKGSIMIDDGKFALSIIGLNINNEKEEVQLLFGDPHVRDNRVYKEAGLYRKTFNSTGKAIGNKLTQKQLEESLYSVYSHLQFQTKCWMVCMIA